MFFEDNSLMGLFSVMAALYALHLVLKRGQSEKQHGDQKDQDIETLSDLREEWEYNLRLCEGIAQGVAEFREDAHFRTQIWERYGGEFPLTLEELDRIEKTYEFLMEMQGELEASSSKSTGSLPIDALVPLIESDKDSVAEALDIIDHAIKELKL